MSAHVSWPGEKKDQFFPPRTVTDPSNLLKNNRTSNNHIHEVATDYAAL